MLYRCVYTSKRRKTVSGLRKKKRMVVYNDLDHLAGTWSDKEYKEFQKIMKDFETIDETMWR